jgi:hypothetical protein
MHERSSGLSLCEEMLAAFGLPSRQTCKFCKLSLTFFICSNTNSSRLFGHFQSSFRCFNAARAPESPLFAAIMYSSTARVESRLT